MSQDTIKSPALAAVIGSPVRHSLSPTIHNAAFRHTGLDWLFVAWDVPSGLTEDALQAMKTFNLAGLSVTMPHKTAVAEAVDQLSPEAGKLNAVNCVARQGDQLVGHNTDGAGFVASLKADADFNPEGKSCFVAGAGGAGRAVILALAQAGAARVGIMNRTQAKAQAAADLAGEAAEIADVEVADADAIGNFDLVVNATPVGMPDFAGQTPFPTTGLHAKQLVVDLIYQPWETPLLKAARAQGIAALNGFGMLVHQAGVAFELWTGIPAPVEAMTAAVSSKITVNSDQQPHL